MALAQRGPELENVTLDLTFGLASEVGFLAPGMEQAFKSTSILPYGPAHFQAVNKRVPGHEFIPMSTSTIGQLLEVGSHREQLRKRFYDNDVCFVMCSPPNKQGYVTFCDQLWYSRDMARNAKITIAEINDQRPILVGPDNWMHVDEFEYMVESTPMELPSDFEQPPADMWEAIELCCTYVAELIDNGDTLCLGGGLIPFMMENYLENKQDLGIHTEAVILPRLMQEGVVNNKKRTLCTGKTSLTGVFAMDTKTQQWIDGNPSFDVRDMKVNNNPKYLSQDDNVVLINSMLEVTLMGEIGVERVGKRMFRGVGGHQELIIGALLSKNGRSIHAAPSRRWSDTEQKWESTIVPFFAHPGVASVPRQLVDFVVTEYGVAALMGKTERERANELIALAHPDFRAELKKEADKLFSV